MWLVSVQFFFFFFFIHFVQQEPVTYTEGAEADELWEVLGGKSKRCFSRVSLLSLFSFSPLSPLTLSPLSLLSLSPSPPPLLLVSCLLYCWRACVFCLKWRVIYRCWLWCLSSSSHRSSRLCAPFTCPAWQLRTHPSPWRPLPRSPLACFRCPTSAVPCAWRRWITSARRT